MVGHIIQKYDSVNADNRTGINLALGVYEAIVKDNRDALLMGRLAVYIPELGGNVDNPKSWKIVRYASPFYGITPYREKELSAGGGSANWGQEGGTAPRDGTDQEQSQSMENGEQPIISYGMWAVPPDVGVTVLVMFAGGDLNRGFWFACVPTISHAMVPANGAPDGKTPMAEFSPIDPEVPVSDDLSSIERKPYEPLVNQFKTQGLDQDPLRGPITSSSFREAPSNVFGISSKSGHNFVMDDGDEQGQSKLIRIRTAAGNQITMHDDTGGTIYLTNASGTGWIEISPSGQIDVFGAAGINLATPGDINIHANNNINMHAGNCVKIVAGNGAKLQGTNELQLHGKKTMIEGVDELHIHSCKDLIITSFSDIHMKAFKYFCLKGKCFFWNSCQAKEAEQVPPEQPQQVSGYQTTVGRAPSKEPYAEHDGGSPGGGPTSGAPTGSMTGNGSDQAGTLVGGSGQPFEFSGSQQQAFDTIYAAAERAGSPDPKMTASIAMLESGWLGSSMTQRANNPFGQTIRAEQIGTHGIVGGTRGADGQLHAVYENIDAAIADHVRRWGSSYVKGNPTQTTSNLVANKYNTVNPAWSGSVNNIYQSSFNTDDAVQVNTATNASNANNAATNSTTAGTSQTNNNNTSNNLTNASYNSYFDNGGTNNVSNTSNNTTLNTENAVPVVDGNTTFDYNYNAGTTTSIGPSGETYTTAPSLDMSTTTNTFAGPNGEAVSTTNNSTLTQANAVQGQDVFTSGNPADQDATEPIENPTNPTLGPTDAPNRTDPSTAAQDASQALGETASQAPASDIPAAPGGGSTGCFATGNNCESPDGGDAGSNPDAGSDQPSGEGSAGLDDNAPAGSVSQKDIYDGLIARGFSPEEARRMSAVAMAESAGKLGAFNGRGADQSYGLFQINMKGALGPARAQQFGLNSYSDLYDFNKNLDAATYIYKTQGINAWGAYTNGSYRKFY